MAILRVNFSGSGLATTDGQCWRVGLRAELAKSHPDRPICVLIHGYRYNPAKCSMDPHRLIFSTRSDLHDPRQVSWPRHLGFGHAAGKTGLCIAYGWPSQGTIWGAHQRAERAGQALAKLLDELAQFSQKRPNILCHSLGARVALAAARHTKAAGLGRVIMMAGAEHAALAQETAYQHADCGTEFFNICSRENDLFDALFELGLAGKGQFGRALGQSLSARPDNWIDIQIDAPATRAAMADIGMPIAPPVRSVCHWSGYLRPGMLRFYKALMHRPDAYSLNRLSQTLPSEISPRWSGLRGQCG